VNSAGGRSLVSAGMPQSERDLLFCEVLLSRPKNRLLSGDAKVKKPNIPDGSKNG
jgi:hypothetical protein